VAKYGTDVIKYGTDMTWNHYGTGIIKHGNDVGPNLNGSKINLNNCEAILSEK
jgi:hypothetical protein